MECAGRGTESVNAVQAAQIIGKTARVVRLSSGIVGRGPVCTLGEGSIEVRLEKPLLAGAAGKVLLEVFEGDTVFQTEAEIVGQAPGSVTLEIEPTLVSQEDGVRLWWTRLATRGFAAGEHGEREVSLKALSLEHGAFDSSWPLAGETEYDLRIVSEASEAFATAKLLWQRTFGGIVHGVVELPVPERLDFARWRRFVEECTGVVSKQLALRP